MTQRMQEIKRSTKDKEYFESMSEVQFQDTYPEASDWIRRMDKSINKRPTRSISFIGQEGAWGRYRWASVACILLLTAAGFIPLKDIDVLGYLIYAEIEGDTVNAAAHMEQYDFPLPQAVFVPEPEEEKTRLVILLRGYTDADIEPLVGSLQEDQHMEGLEVQPVEEEIQRSIYESFFDHLPASLERYNLRENLEWRRWSRLYRPHIARWLDTEEVRYGLNSSIVDGVAHYRVLPLGISPLPSETEQLFEEYNRVDRAIAFLESDHQSVEQARVILEAYRDSLDARISGKRE